MHQVTDRIGTNERHSPDVWMVADKVNGVLGTVNDVEHTCKNKAHQHHNVKQASPDRLLSEVSKQFSAVMRQLKQNQSRSAETQMGGTIFKENKSRISKIMRICVSNAVIIRDAVEASSVQNSSASSMNVDVAFPVMSLIGSFSKVEKND